MAKRAGNPKAREQEFQSVVQAVRKNKDAFIRRLQGLVTVDPAPRYRFDQVVLPLSKHMSIDDVHLITDPPVIAHDIGPCIRFLGAHTKDGYGRLTMSYFRSMPGKRKLQRKKLSVYAHRLFLILRLGRPIKIKHDAGHEPGCPHRDCVRHVFEQPMSENCATAIQTAVSF